jgi:hypothetical protein
VLAWSAHTDNPVEAEYILMEVAEGTQLGDIWHEMEIERKLQITRDIVGIEKKLLSASFTRSVFQKATIVTPTSDTGDAVTEVSTSLVIPFQDVRMPWLWAKWSPVW